MFKLKKATEFTGTPKPQPQKEKKKKPTIEREQINDQFSMLNHIDSLLR